MPLAARDKPQALLVFNQSLVLSSMAGVIFFVLAMALRTTYAEKVAADALTADLASDYLLWFIPAMALQFGIVAMSAALRGTGNFKPGMVVQSSTVVLNMVLAPFLIFGWGTGHPLGVAGAAISTLVAVAVGSVWLTLYFLPEDSFLRFVPADARPQIGLWGRLLKIGLPAGAEFGMTTIYMLLVYIVTRPFGAAAQAGLRRRTPPRPRGLPARRRARLLGRTGGGTELRRAAAGARATDVPDAVRRSLRF